jgi:hypothetical protein
LRPWEAALSAGGYWRERLEIDRGATASESGAGPPRARLLAREVPGEADGAGRPRLRCCFGEEDDAPHRAAEVVGSTRCGSVRHSPSCERRSFQRHTSHLKRSRSSRLARRIASVMAAASQSEKLRRQIVRALERGGFLRSAHVRAAFLAVPRELFVPAFAGREGLAAVYRDEVIMTKRKCFTLQTSSSESSLERNGPPRSPHSAPVPALGESTRRDAESASRGGTARASRLASAEQWHALPASPSRFPPARSRSGHSPRARSNSPATG